MRHATIYRGMTGSWYKVSDGSAFAYFLCHAWFGAYEAAELVRQNTDGTVQVTVVTRQEIGASENEASLPDSSRTERGLEWPVVIEP